MMALTHRVRNAGARFARHVPILTSLWARYRSRRYEQRIAGFLERKDGRAGRLPMGVVYEATMRCNLHCEFCYVGTILNIEGEWREELPLDVLRRAFPDHDGLQVSLTGGEIFMRKDILQVMEVFREKGYVCGYLTTNGTIISEERAQAVNAAVARLPERYRVPLALAYYADADYAEIAAALGITRTHVGVLLCRGKQLLRQSFAEEP